jgi:hypothetical protein
MRKVLAALAATAAVFAGSAALAPAALAASYDTYGCSGLLVYAIPAGDQVTVHTPSGKYVSGIPAPGDCYFGDWGGGGDSYGFQDPNYMWSTIGIDGPNGGGGVLSYDSAGGNIVEIISCGVPGLRSILDEYAAHGYKVINLCNLDAPVPVLQQVGVPASGSCADVSDVYDWVGVTGGWSKSWAQWINDGKGGEVCTRELVYSPSAGAWIAQ